MSELQEALEVETTDELNTGLDTGSELAPDTAEMQETNIEDEGNNGEGEAIPEAANVDEQETEQTIATRKAINKKHFQMKESDRRADRLEKENQELRAKVEQKPALELSSVPPLPDAFEDDFDTKMAARDAVIAQNGEFRALEGINAKNEATRVEQTRREQAEYVKELNETFDASIEKHGADREKVDKAADTLIKYGMDSETAQFIMTDPDGPLLAMHFEADLQGFDDYMRLSGIQKGVKLSSIKAKAQSFRPKTSNAPDPATQLRGKTAPADRGPKGATFT